MDHVIEGFRLSPQQQTLFDRGDAAAQLAQATLLVEGPVTAEQLGAAVRALATRHEILRTRFEHLPGMAAALQVISEEPLLELSFHQAGADADIDAEANALAAQARAAGFALATGPMLRAQVLQLGAERALLVLTAPALCLDARSLGNLVRALGGELAGERDGDGADGDGDDDELLQYGQFSEWQHQLDEEEDAPRAAAFWQQHLSGATPTARLPLERAAIPDDGAPAPAPSAVTLTWTKEELAGLEARLAARGLRAERYLLACWLVLLARATGQEQLQTVVCCDGRTLSELDDALGLMTTPVPLRLDVELAASGDRLLEAIEFAMRDVEAFQGFCPREHAAHDAAHTAFEYVRAADAHQAGALRVSLLVRRWSADPRLALKLIVEHAPGRALTCTLQHDPRRLDEALVGTLARALQQVSAQLVAEPGWPLARLTLMSADDERATLQALGRGAAPDVAALPEADALRAWTRAAERYAERVAYIYQDHQLTYRELDQRADRVAAQLVARGVRPGDVVPMLLDRGPDTLTGLIGILKTGAAFLPLDPTQPARRMAAVLREVAPLTFVTRAGLATPLFAAVPELPSAPVVVDDPDVQARPAHALDVAVAPASPVYVLYTSGSTGAPKGVVIRHDAVVNLARALQAEIHGGERAPRRVSLNANLTFDSSVKQWTRLFFGDTLIGVPEEVRTSGDELRAHLEQHRCEVLDCTPSQLEILLAAGLPAGLSRALLGGEAISAELWQRLLELQRASGCQFFNVYGPTECTVNAVWSPITERPRDRDGRLTPVLGRAIPGARVVLLDAHGQAVPPGFTGELCIGGAGVAAGYLRDPARTAERFVPDPHSDTPGARLYRSGDLARFVPDGALEFLGRRDHQVKLRGLRIELGEIEAALRSHPAVRECAVLLREDRPGDQRLVAYVVSAQRRAAARPGAVSTEPDAAGYRLPNGLAVAHQNKNETDYLYEEIFQKQTYACYGIQLPDDAVIFDVGANIGMYSLYVLQHCERPRIFAFEPLPPIAASLVENMRRHGPGVTVFPFGLSDQETSVDFTYYPYYSMMSSAASYSRPEEEVEVVRRFLEKEAEGSAEQPADSETARNARELLTHADELLRFRFEGQTHRCQLRRLTDVIREQGVTHIDLLKVDVQRAELDVLRGLTDADWAVIDQVVMEVHQDPHSDSAHRVAEITELLERHGLTVIAEQDPLLVGTDRFNLYASRLGLGARDALRVRPLAERGERGAAEAAVTAPSTTPSTTEDLQRHASAWLPEYMVPQAVVMLDALPLSRHGKVDRAALPSPEPELRAHAAPRTPRERELLELWSEVLGTPHLGVEDNFFHLGGHSLLATQLMARIRKRFEVELPLRLIFEAPTIARLAAALEERHVGETPTPPLRPAPRGGLLPLSFAQQRLWFIDQLEPGTTAYNNAFAFRCEGPLAAARLDRALAAVIARHEVLRTRFLPVDDAARAAHGATSPDQVAYQVIDAPAASYLELIDLSTSGTSAEREEAAQALRRAEADAPFDLARGPVFRAKLIRLHAEEHLLLFTAHHIACDEWSLPIFARELGQLYASLPDASAADDHAGAPDAGQLDALPPLPVQYADVAVWQRGWLAGAELERQVAHWRRELAGLPPVLDLPLDVPRTPARSYRGHAAPLELSAQVTAALRALADETGATPFMLLLAGYAALLSRLAGQRDLCIGIPDAGRAHLETEHLIGFFINVLPIRIDLSGRPSFRELVGRVREAQLRALAHQALPFEKLVEELELPRDLAHSPVFQVTFHLRDARAALGGDAELALPGVTLRSAGDDSDDAHIRYDLSLSLDNSGPTLTGALISNAALFSAETGARLAALLVRLLTAIAAAPDQALTELALLDPEEERRALDAWHTSAPLDKEASLASLWRARVAAYPDAPALWAGGVELDTAQLDARATAVAHALRARGVKAEDRVAILAERSCDLFVGILGALLAGAAYVPLDPGYPAARLLWMVQDAAPAAILTQDALLPRVPACACPVLSLDELAAAAPTAPAPLPRVLPGQLAYQLYTSGSTGKPKGVMITHRSAVNLRAALRAALYDRFLSQLAAEGELRRLRVTVNAPVVFDSSVKQLLTWFDGHCLVSVPEDVRRDAERFVAWLGEQRIDVLDTTPSLLTLLLDAGLLADPTRAPRHVLIGGEAISPALWRRLQASTRPTFHNLYGPTECTVNATARTVRADDPVPVLGVPLPNVRAYLLDEARRPVPTGVTGELYLGGAGVARGYRGRAALTAERFLPDPFSSVAGARLYRTGDLARVTASGELAFVGRADSQVKLRGYRIELGEIEAALLAHPGVRQGVALVQAGGGPRGEQLAVYAVARPGAAPSVRALREHLAAQLPEHMVPSLVALVPEIPLTLNKKVDVAALVAAGAGAAGATHVDDAQAPRAPLEQVVLGVLSELLGLAEIGLDADFFTELGGHSLLAIQLVARLRAALRLPLELRAIFDHPTPRRLARLITQKLRQGAALEAPPIEPVPRDQPLPLSFAQRRLWILDRMDPGSAVYNNPKVIPLPGDLDVAALGRAVDELVRRHEALRTRFALPERADGDAPGELDAEPVQLIAPHLPRELPLVDLSHLPEADARAEAARLAALEAAQPFDLAAGPLVRFTLVRVAPQLHALLFTMHHIITDARSLDILWEEASALYQAFSAGRPSPLPMPTLHVADHAAWQHRWLTGEPLQQQLAFWRERLAGLPTLSLPYDHPAEAFDPSDGAIHRFRLDRATTAALAATARAHDTTPFMALLAGFAALLSRVAGQRDVAIGTPVSGRNQRETENMVGFFVNMLVLRCDLRGAPTFADLLARTREVVLSAFAHQDLPFEKLVEELAPSRDTARSPLFQVALSYQELPPRALADDTTAGAAGDVPGDDVDALALETSVAKFDLSLGAAHRPGEELTLSLEYKRALFEPESIDRLAGQLQRLLAAALASPKTPLDALDLRDDAERALMARWNDTGAALPPEARERCLHELLAAQVSRAPAHLALLCGDEQVSYAELQARARRLAHHLRALGVDRRSVVGVLLERSISQAVTFLGVLEAGAAYLPLDPTQPAERLAFALRDAGACALVTQRALAARAGEFDGQVLLLDEAAALLAKQPETPLERVFADDLAYILYTSGSTGAPKGVAVTHGNLVHLFAATGERFPLRASDRVLVKANATFDAAAWELFAPLSAGATCVLAEPGGQRDPAYLARLMTSAQVTCVDLVPSLLDALLDAMAQDPAASCPALRLVVSGAEALPPELVASFHARLGARGVELLNTYGPTEATVEVSSWRCAAEDANATIPIGTPLPRTRLYILDAALRPVPIGVAGELCIAGPQVARGYVRRPSLTAERFVPDPSSPVPGARMYRTGDLARFRPEGDGAIEFLGRRDHQIKLRGLRIELGEIEAALALHPSVREAVVVLRDQRLCAYVATDAPETPIADALRAHLRASLPEYMVPSSFTALAALPRGSSGKLDRQALPAPLHPTGAAHVHPRTPREWQVWRVMSEVLRVDTLGVTDNFFDLGGHSLSAVTLVHRLAADSGQPLPLAAVFQRPTVEQLAELLSELAAGAARAADRVGSPLVELQRAGAGSSPPWFWVHPVGGTAFCYANLARALGAHQACYALQTPGLEPGSTVLRSMDALVAVYADLVQSRCPQGPIQLGGWSMGGVVAFALASALTRAGRVVRPLVLVDSFPYLGPPRQPPEAERLRGFLGNLELSAEQVGLDPNAEWSREQLLQAVLAEAKELGAIPRSTDLALIGRYYDVYSANLDVLRAYQPQPYDGEVLLLHGRAVTEEKLGAWRRVVGGNLKELPIDGPHESLMSPPHVLSIAELIRDLGDAGAVAPTKPRSTRRGSLG
ncbi:MAG: amino acid adenylation domain-containing protein [Kofleriaceae bacterium]